MSEEDNDNSNNDNNDNEREMSIKPITDIEEVPTIDRSHRNTF